MNPDLDHTWSRVRAQLRLAVDEPTFRLWLEPLQPVALEGERLVLQAPAQAEGWIGARFGRLLDASAQLVLGPTASVVLGASWAPACGTPENEQTATPPPPASSGPLGNPKLTFEQFVIGDANRLAHAAALTVAEMPAQAYNPLFLCGPPGVGKTHLLSAIANLLTAHDPTLHVRCTTGESFTNEFLRALSASGTEQFKRRFRDVDVLLVDDVQFLERKTRTEEEFFHTFNAMHDAGRQVVLTSDRPPHDLQALEDRLRERFQAGLVADISAPDLTTRLGIMRKRALHDGVELADERALEVIARRVESNVRALEGALIRVVAYSSLTGRPLTGELAETVLDGISPRPARPGTRTITAADVQRATCELFGITPDELLSSGRSPRVVWPRQVAMYLTRELSGDSLPAIGRHFGGRDHSTVLHACRRTSKRIADDRDAQAAVEKLRTMLNDA